MRYCSIIDCDIANGNYWRVSLFVSGCRIHCKGCFNKSAWDFNGGTEYTQETENKIIELLSRPYIRGLSLLGGNPTEPENEPDLIKLCKRVKAELPGKDIWLWTGHSIEELTDRKDELVELSDVIIEGQFIEELKDVTLPWRGSTNQRIICRFNSFDEVSNLISDGTKP